MNKDELFEFHKSLCHKALELMKQKNADYAGSKGKTPFANFEVCENMRITKTETGMLVRLCDKFSRLSSFNEAGVFQVRDEKLEDTIIDVINYSILYLAYIEREKEKQKASIGK